MSVRKASLEEWFLIYQLEKIKKGHFHLPFYMTVNISKLAKFYAEKEKKIPLTALMIKAAGLLAKKHPEVNRIVFKTFYGLRIFDPNYISVNLPIMIDVEGQRFLAATVIENVDKATISKINEEIKMALSQRLSDLKIGKYVYKKRNNFINRSRLKLIHFLINNFPKVYENFGGGALAVSSLMNHNHEDFDMSMMAYGPTAFTICSCNHIKKKDEDFLKIGIAYDHFAFSGEKAIEASQYLSHILTGKNEGDFSSLVE
ncbi:MAG: hypothetical protein CME70_13155 [Halobacteriovorax sp.]|nr:hypothetical protein [Halobacteriovorax sp.]